MWRRFLDLHALRWSLLAPLILAFGAGWYLTLKNEPSMLVVHGASVLLLVTGWMLHRMLRPTLALAAFLLSMFPLGASVAALHAIASHAPRIEIRTRPVRVEGVLARIDAGEKGNRLLIEVSAISDMSRADTPEKVRLTQRNATHIVPGNPVSCLAMLMPPPGPTAPGDYDFQRQAWFDHLGGVGFVLGECTPAINDTTRRGRLAPLADWIAGVRRSLALSVFDMAGEEGGGVAAAMVSGDRSLMSNEDADTLRKAGLAHLLAISGLHMGLAGGVFFFGAQWLVRLIEPLSLRVPPRKFAAVVSLVACTTYLLLSGAAVATQRAYVMAAVALVAILIDRAALSARSLAVAMIVVVMIQPQTVTTPGFQMSFAATAALIAMYEAWPRRKQSSSRSIVSRSVGWVVSLAATSIVASLATAPFSAYHFGRVALWSIPANLAVMPIISIWTTPSAALAAVFSPIGWAEPFIASMGLSLKLVLEIASHFSDDTVAVNWPPVTDESMILFTVGICIATVLGGLYRLISIPIIAAASILWWTAPIPFLLTSVSGDMYIQSGATWTKVANIDGQSSKGVMDPMQVSDRLVANACKARECIYPIVQGRHLILRQDEEGAPTEILLSAAPNLAEDGSNVLDISHILNGQGSFKVSVTRQGLSTQFSPATLERPRPWSSYQD